MTPGFCGRVSTLDKKQSADVIDYKCGKISNCGLENHHQKRIAGTAKLFFHCGNGCCTGGVEQGEHQKRIGGKRRHGLGQNGKELLLRCTV